MAWTISRRGLLAGSAAALLGGGRAFAREEDADLRLAALERQTGGRLGVAVLDNGTGISFGRRQDERFALCSTFKALAAACVLARVDRAEERLDRRIVYGPGALVPYSPVTEKFAGREGMTLAAICDAAITLSDNTAGNLLLEAIGGPEGLTGWLRETGDTATRLDRIEPDLNEARKGDPRDTTTPDAMLASIGRLVLGDVLTPPSRERLAGWMVANKTGDARLRAGLPKGWRIGDKTGTCGNGTAADVAVVWPPRREPVLIAVYIAEASVPAADLNPVFAEVGRIVTELVG